MQHFFQPLKREPLYVQPSHSVDPFANHIVSYYDGGAFPDLEASDLVMFGILEDRGAVGNSGCKDAARHIRHKMYSLASPVDGVAMIDLGDLIPGKELTDTYSAVTHVVSSLIGRGKTIIVLGGSQDITFAVYQAYAAIGRVINITAVDPAFDLAEGDAVNSHNYLRHIINQQPNYLFHFTNLSYQSYFVGNAYLRLMEELRFSAYSLAEVQQDIMTAEPLLRNADVVTVDIGCVRQSDAPANAFPSPHGLYGEQLCQLHRFAGMSDKNSLLHISELNPVYDHDEQTAHLISHALWFYVQGFYARMGDYPVPDSENYKTYKVQVSELDNPICFYKSKRSDRWWMAVGCDDEEKRQLYGSQHLVPCSYRDYERAMHDELPPLWLQYYHWLNDEM